MTFRLESKRWSGVCASTTGNLCTVKIDETIQDASLGATFAMTGPATKARKVGGRSL
jgi:hypothetical protein